MTEPVVAAKVPAKVTLEAGKDYWWCACGLSSKQPFCDGFHKGGAFVPTKFTAEKSTSSEGIALLPRADLRKSR